MGLAPEMVPKDTSLPVQWLLAIGFYFATFLAVALALALEEEESATSEMVVLYSTPITTLDKYGNLIQLKHARGVASRRC
jgi:hypothetical protein